MDQSNHLETEDKVSKILSKQTEIEEAIRKGKESLNKDFSNLEGQLNSLKQLQRELKEIVETSKKFKVNYEHYLKALNIKIKKFEEEFTPSHGSLFVRLFLGQVNVKHYREGERYILKTEYMKFKYRTDFLFLAFVLVQLFLFIRNRAVEILFQVWLLYYYTSLALRENILKVNGSNINHWWIIHHYLSVTICICFLTWSPSSQNYELFLEQFLYFSLLQGLVQIMQSLYQRSKLYKMIAIGKATRMDVTSELSSNILVDYGCSSVLILLPFLIVVQSFQIYNSYTLLTLAYLKPHVEWQVYACGIIFGALGIGNLSTTIYTYKQKLKHKNN